MKYTINAKYKNGEFEEIDTADRRSDAIFLKNQYAIAFGADHTIKINKSNK